MSVQVTHEQKENRQGANVGEFISFESTGWWGGSPVSFKREYNTWSMSTSSGGQNQVDVLDQIRDMKAMLDYAEKVIVEQRSMEIM